MYAITIEPGRLPLSERQGLANALLRRTRTAVQQETRVALLGLLIHTDASVLADAP
jgi:hypothetical protein